MSAIFGLKGWDIAYYLCADIGGGGWLAWLVIYKLINSQYKKIVLPVLIFSIIVFLWDITSYATGIGVNNPGAVGIGFGLAVLIVLYFMIMEIKWQKGKYF